MKDVESVHPHVAREGVADGVVAHVSHVQRAGGIGQHFEDVIFLFGGIAIGGVELGIVLPVGGPLCFYALGIVALVVGTIGGTRPRSRRGRWRSR